MRAACHLALSTRTQLAGWICAACLLCALGCGHTAAGGAADSRGCSPLPPLSGFELVVLGSGGPRSAGRAASSYAIVVDGRARLLVDIGPGAFVRLGESGLSTQALDTVLLTHLHVDHAGDLPGFVKSRDLGADGALRFRVFGPSAGAPYPSTSAFVERLFGGDGAFAYLPEFRNPLSFDVRDVAADLAAPLRPLLAEDGLSVSAIAVDHGDVPALAYRITYAGQSIVLTGDLASKRGNLAQLARGADLLVYDAAVLDPPSSPDALYELHTPPHVIGKKAREAGVGALLLGHISAAVDANRPAVLASIRDSFSGPVSFAADCMHVPVGASRSRADGR